MRRGLLLSIARIAEMLRDGSVHKRGGILLVALEI